MGTSSTVIIASHRSCPNKWGTERVLPPRTTTETRPLRPEAKDRALKMHSAKLSEFAGA